jgi:deoxyribonuclease V
MSLRLPIHKPETQSNAMKVHRFHSWNVTPAEAIRIQQRMRERVIRRETVPAPEFVAGADAAFDIEARRVYAAVVVLRFPGLEPVETVVTVSRLSFPYIPGLLTFREAPALLRAFAKVRHDPQVIFIDGHGLSHPRAAGIACHIGLSLDRPVIGFAKSLLTGTYKEPAVSRGASSPLYGEAGTIIGAAVRTRDNARLPEPTRQADLLAEQAKRESGFPLKTRSKGKVS